MNFLVQKEHNTAILTKNGENVMVHVDQFKSRMEPEDIEIDEESEGEEH